MEHQPRTNRGLPQPSTEQMSFIRPSLLQRHYDAVIVSWLVWVMLIVASVTLCAPKST
jgi:hypothetical protein